MKQKQTTRKKKWKKKVNMQRDGRPKEHDLAPGRDRASSRSTRSWLMDSSCDSSALSVGCVVGRCWEACPSWVPVSLVGLSSWLAGSPQCLCIISENIMLLIKDRRNRARQGRAG